MAVKVGINGFGRIGRNVFRAALGNPETRIRRGQRPDQPSTLAHLLKYDSILGNLHHDITAGEDFITVDGKKIKVFAEQDPAKLDWASVGAQVVVESTGRFTDATRPRPTSQGTVKKVIISAPANNEDITIVLGVNEDKYDPPSTTSSPTPPAPPTAWRPSSRCCTTTSASSTGSMTTIHSYTNDQVILDFPHKDLRRARAAALNMIPTTTGAAKAIKLVHAGDCRASSTASPCASPRPTSRWSI